MPELAGMVDPRRDRVLVERCQSGDSSAFHELYELYHHRLLRFCLRRLKTVCDAEEAVQEAFLHAWKALPRFDGERRFYPWLVVIASNVSVDVLRRRRRIVLTEVVEAGPIEVVPEADFELMRTVELKMLAEAFMHLSERHRRILTLREGTRFSSRQIADKEGIDAAAVDVVVWRARQAYKRNVAALANSL